MRAVSRILPTLTPGKLAWLRQLERDGRGHRPKGNVGRNCMVNGWTDWIVRDRRGGGELLFNQSRALITAGSATNDDFEFTGDEILTDAGRKLLKGAAA